LSASILLRAFGNYRLTILFACIDLLAVLGLAYISEIRFILPLFVLHQTLVPMILFNLDIFLEQHNNQNESSRRTRGIFLTVTNLALVLTPLIWTLLNINETNFSKIYLLSGLFLIPLITIITVSMRSFKDDFYNQFNFKHIVASFFRNKDLGSVLMANFLLQIFYTFVVIYVPIYLVTVVGFSWQEFSLMLSIALIPFLIFELPVGFLADKLFGEKEIMGLGFIILSFSLFLLAYIQKPEFLVFAIVLFLTRNLLLNRNYN
jgi:sugar phosphate permease